METFSHGPTNKPRPQDAEIFQLGAVTMNQYGETFQKYLLPPDISGTIPTYDKIKHRFVVDEDKLLKDGKEVSWVRSKRGLAMFIAFLKNAADANGVVYLIAHNGKSFDFPILANNLRHYDVNIPDDLTIKLFDSMAFVREKGFTGEL